MTTRQTKVQIFRCMGSRTLDSLTKTGARSFGCNCRKGGWVVCTGNKIWGHADTKAMAKKVANTLRNAIKFGLL